jgi:SNF2 family DNA or RNA helicase
VMPLSLIWNWENEIRKFTPHLKVHKHFGSSRTTDPSVFYKYDIILTTYGVVRNDLEMLSRCEFRYVILDESQIIKNPFSKLFRAVKQLKSKYRLVLTGTPIENTLSDLWAQMTFLNNGILGNLAYFKEEFAYPIEKLRDKGKEEKLKTIIAPFLLRRTKEMVAKDLPSLTETVYYCEMSDEQKDLYESRKSEVRNLLMASIAEHGTEKSRFAILRGLMQLRLLANHPVLLPDGIDLPSGKFEEVIRSIDNILSEGHKILIFSSFVKHLRLFAKYFDEKGWGYCMLTGEKTTPERIKAVQQFQELPDKKLFLITLKAGGVGLNLTAADYVFMLDPWWNPASENQAISRAHRIGQDKKVIAFKYITRNTIEEKILTLQQNKSEIASLFVNNNDPLKFFTRETILQLTE